MQFLRAGNILIHLEHVQAVALDRVGKVIISYPGGDITYSGEEAALLRKAFNNCLPVDDAEMKTGRQPQIVIPVQGGRIG